MSLYINLYPQGIEEITCFLKQQWQHTQRKKKGNYLFAWNGSFSGSEGDDEYAVAVTR
jgi:hypothetical protein